MAKRSSLIDTRVIYCGDCLEQLQRLPDACVDLVYIDPPFNSNRNYEVFWGETKEKRAFEDRHASTQAYIDYMRPRCVELARVLKATGSLYFHCDWHACHYVKVMLDQILGENQFRNEIAWRRSSAHSDTKQGMKQYGRVHDLIFFYTKGKQWTWNTQFQPYDEDYIEAFYRHVEPDTGRRYRLSDLTAAKPGGDTLYEWKGRKPYKGRYWAYSREKMQQFEDEGRLYYSKTGMPAYKRYLDEMPGVPLQDLWTDIRPIAASAKERTGYPTQKPLPLLERIIRASSNEGDVVLDAFCGCGTALEAAQKLKRQWIGIDVSPTACQVMARRLERQCNVRESDVLWKAGRGFIVRDLPWTVEKLRELPPFEFENWAVIALNGLPNRVQVGDMGIDGRIYPVSALPERPAPDQLGFMDVWYPIQVKQKAKVGRPDIDQFEAVMMREKRQQGFFVGFEFTSDALREIEAFQRRENREIIPARVHDILQGTLTRPVPVVEVPTTTTESRPRPSLREARNATQQSAARRTRRKRGA